MLPEKLLQQKSALPFKEENPLKKNPEIHFTFSVIKKPG